MGKKIAIVVLIVAITLTFSVPAILMMRYHE